MVNAFKQIITVLLSIGTFFFLVSCGESNPYKDHKAITDNAVKAKGIHKQQSKFLAIPNEFFDIEIPQLVIFNGSQSSQNLTLKISPTDASVSLDQFKLTLASDEIYSGAKIEFNQETGLYEIIWSPSSSFIGKNKVDNTAKALAFDFNIYISSKSNDFTFADIKLSIPVIVVPSDFTVDTNHLQADSSQNEETK